MTLSSRTVRGILAFAGLTLAGACSGSRGAGGNGPSPVVTNINPAEQLERADEALAADSTDVDGWFERAKALEALERPDSALAAYETLLRLEPENVEVIVHHALTLDIDG